MFEFTGRGRPWTGEACRKGYREGSLSLPDRRQNTREKMVQTSKTREIEWCNNKEEMRVFESDDSGGDGSGGKNDGRYVGGSFKIVANGKIGGMGMLNDGG